MKYLLFAVALSACTSSVASPDLEAELNTGMISQERSKWCWAAIIENLTGVPQCEVPAAVYPELSELDCCSKDADACNVQGNVYVGLDLAAGVQSVYERSALSAEDLDAELSAGRKVVAHLRNATAGHVMLITERTANAYRVYDPASDHMFKVSYKHILNGFTVQEAPVTWQATTWKIGANL